MEQPRLKGTLLQTTSTCTFSMEIKNTSYVIGVHFSQSEKDTLEDKNECRFQIDFLAGLLIQQKKLDCLLLLFLRAPVT